MSEPRENQENDLENIHISVLPEEILEYLKPKTGDVIIDGTLGLAGHAIKILPHILPDGKYVGIERDQKTLALAKKRLEPYKDNCIFVNDNFRNIDEVLLSEGVTGAHGIILDLGISSFQLSDSSRGFSLKTDGPLDMRMDQEQETTAFDLINSLSEKEIAEILNDFGEERFSRRVARFIIEHRADKPIETTSELRQIVNKAMPGNRNRQRIDPATRTFQAFRIVVNQELDALKEAINKCIEALLPGGRLGIISFHSLEDRIVKNSFKNAVTNGQIEILTKKPLQPSDTEIHYNSRSRSARLRFAQKTL